eukprot:SAG11_NODE_1060_length_6001_cov_2.264317_4_plen_439_part_00
MRVKGGGGNRKTKKEKHKGNRQQTKNTKSAFLIYLCIFYFIYLDKRGDLTRKRESADIADEKLRNMQALSEDGTDLTPLGRILARLPTEPRLGMLLIYGTLFGVGEEVLTIAAVILTRSPLVLPPEEHRPAAMRAHRSLAPVTASSDHQCAIAAFKEWCVISKTQGDDAAGQYCRTNFLSKSSLSDIRTKRAELALAVSQVGLAPLSCAPTLVASPRLADDTEAAEAKTIDQMVRAALTAAMAPSLLSVYARVDGRAGFRTATNCRVLLHPSGVNAQRTFDDFVRHSGETQSVPWLVYHDLITVPRQDSTQYELMARGVTVANAAALLLLGTGRPWARVQTPQGFEGVLHGWVRFRCGRHPKVGSSRGGGDLEMLEMLDALRGHLDAALMKVASKVEALVGSRRGGSCTASPTAAAQVELDEYERHVFTMAFSIINSC